MAARIILILQLSHDALVADEILTKRHIFYQNQELFEKQAKVDELVDCVALTLGVGREDLNIVAASKGMIAGPVELRLQENSTLDASTSEAGLSIPPTKTILEIDTTKIRWVLVVEKDAVFRSLCSAGFGQTSLHGPGLLVTARGYPDDLTCSFLYRLHEHDPQLPILVLVDWDPDGLNIFRCYCYGSFRNNERRNNGVHYLGIKYDHVSDLKAEASTAAGFESSQSSVSSTNSRDPVTYLTTRDRGVASGILQRLEEASHEDQRSVELKRELQIMLCLGVKVEIQWLDESGSLTNWLDDQIGHFLRGD